LLLGTRGQEPVFYVRDTNARMHCGNISAPSPAWKGSAAQLSIDAIKLSGAGTEFSFTTPLRGLREIAPDLGIRASRIDSQRRSASAAPTKLFQSWYKLPAPHANWLGEAIYGTHEFLRGEIARARLVPIRVVLRQPGGPRTAPAIGGSTGALTAAIESATASRASARARNRGGICNSSRSTACKA